MIYLITVSLLAFIFVKASNYLTGKRIIGDFLHLNKIRRKQLIQLDDRWAESSDYSDIVISLTTIPIRIHHIENTIKSLLWQNRLPKKILLNIPFKSFRDGKEYDIPEWLQKLKSVEIVRTEEDYGPATKFIPTLESQDEDQLILVLDDDHLYPPNYVKDFESASKTHPEHILSASGWRVPKDLTDRNTTLYRNIFNIPPTPVKGTRVRNLYKTDIIQGYAGYLIKSKFFHIERLKDYSNSPAEMRFVDDVWISAHSLVPKYIIPLKRYCYNPFATRKFFKSTSLAKISNKDKKGNEDRYNSVGIRYFKEKWK